MRSLDQVLARYLALEEIKAIAQIKFTAGKYVIEHHDEIRRLIFG